LSYTPTRIASSVILGLLRRDINKRRGPSQGQTGPRLNPAAGRRPGRRPLRDPILRHRAGLARRLRAAEETSGKRRPMAWHTRTDCAFRALKFRRPPGADGSEQKGGSTPPRGDLYPIDTCLLMGDP